MSTSPIAPAVPGALQPGQPQRGPASDKMEPGPTVVFVGGIPATLQAPDELTAFLAESFGPVESFKLIVDAGTSRHKGYGFVKFASAESAESARRVRSIDFKGKMMNLGNAYSGGSQIRRPAPQPGRAGMPLVQPMGGYLPNPYSFMGGNYPAPQIPTPYAQAPVLRNPNPTTPGGAPGAEEGVCRYWLRNICRKGAACPFKHPGQPGGAEAGLNPAICPPARGGYSGPTAGGEGYSDYYSQMYAQPMYYQAQYTGIPTTTAGMSALPAGSWTAGAAVYPSGYPSTS